MNALERAVEKAGGQSALARGIGGKVKQGHIWYWLNMAGGKVPDVHVAKVEELTGVSRYELRPDIFGSAPPAVSPETEGARA